MISKGSAGYWSTGITLRRTETSRGPGWDGHVEYFDDGFVGDDNADTGAVSTQGKLHTRYSVRDGDTVTGLRAVIDTLIADATRLSIEFGGPSGDPKLYYAGDGEYDAFPPPKGWQGMLAAEAERIGWASPYVAAEEG